MAAMGGSNSVVQTGFRARNDDGSETTATWKAALNTNWYQPYGQNFRLRILTERDSLANGWNVQHLLQASYNGGAYFAVTTATSIVKIVSSTYFTDGDDTTQQLGSLTWTGDVGDEGMISGTTDNTTATMFYDLGNDMEFEFEVCMQVIEADVSIRDTIAFRGYDNTGATTYSGGYSETPTLTVAHPNTIGDATQTIRSAGRAAGFLGPAVDAIPAAVFAARSAQYIGR